MTSQWRTLSAEEITHLSQQGCTCGDWSRVQVAEAFRVDRVREAHFSGDVRLGVFEKEVSFFGGLLRPAGINHATIHNCTVGDNVYIGAVHNHIANYVIEDEAVIDNVDLLAVEGEAPSATEHRSRSSTKPEDGKFRSTIIFRLTRPIFWPSTATGPR